MQKGNISEKLYRMMLKMSIVNAIEVKGLSKHFKIPDKDKSRQNHPNSTKKKQINAIRAVDEINFHVRKGEIFGFLGPNGAGKTTTIRMLTGILKPSGGTITIFGKNFWKNTLIVQQIMGHVPEMANAYLDLTGIQNLNLIGELYGIDKTKRNERANHLLKKFGLFERRNLKAKAYSKGMKQRLLLCMALISDPKILFLDEPTSGLDVQSSMIIKSLIKEYNKAGMTIVVTTHNMDVANELCDRIAIINRGKLAGLDTPENLRRLKQEYLALDLRFSDTTTQPGELESLHYIKKVTQSDGLYHVVVENINDGICKLIEYAQSHDLEIEYISTYEPRLQDVFLQIINDGEGPNV
jgi:ABC-2 type transport system ATP-binding protein